MLNVLDEVVRSFKLRSFKLVHSSSCLHCRWVTLQSLILLLQVLGSETKCLKGGGAEVHSTSQNAVPSSTSVWGGGVWAVCS